MGHAARRNETAQAAQRGELLSRQSIMGAMDHALEIHASALRLLEAKIVALKARIEKLEEVLHGKPTPVEYTDADAAFQRVADTVETQMNGIVSKQQQHESAKPCGCDLGAGWICLQHAKAEYANPD